MLKIKLHEASKEPGVVHNKPLFTKAIKDMLVLDDRYETPQDVPQSVLNDYLQDLKMVNSQWVLDYYKQSSNSEKIVQSIESAVAKGTTLDDAVFQSGAIDNDPFLYTFDGGKYGMLNLVWVDA